MVNCKNCNKQITDSKDVNVLALFGVVPTTMCNDCYASRARGITRYYFYYPRWFAINSKPFIILLVLISARVLFIASLVIFGKTTEAFPGGELIFISILFILLAWQWILWFIARKTMKRVK
jgi:hypothetical protein